jgi:thymidylate synthase
MNIEYIEATTVPDAWFQAVSRILDKGFKYEIQHGSFEGETRLEFDFITIYIKHPYAEPYDLMLPQIPAHLSIPNPVENGYVEQYLPYLMTGEKQEGEDYTYGQRICAYLSGYKNCCMDWEIRKNQVDYWISVFSKTQNTNQAVLQIAQPSDCELIDPPCLRHIDMRIKDNALIFYPYFRSWDLWGGFPANLAGISVLQKYMADEIGVIAGPIIAASKGLHIYGYAEELAKLRTGK